MGLKILKFTMILLVIMTQVSSLSYAKDLGRVGEVYPIKEKDLIDFIQARLGEMERSGKMEKINKQIAETIKKRFERLPPVKGLTPATAYRKWYIDPSILVDYDIKDVEGRVIVKAGTVINPLTKASLKRSYIFYDGDNKTQVAWIVKSKEQINKSKLILVNGSTLEQSKIIKKRIYFDQHGKLVSKFKIAHTPAIITQEGLRFKAEELAL